MPIRLALFALAVGLWSCGETTILHQRRLPSIR